MIWRSIEKHTRMQVDRLIRDKYTVVIGLEVHAQLLTASKIYAPDSNQFGCDPNTNISVITLGHPGVMPKVQLNSHCQKLPS